MKAILVVDMPKSCEECPLMAMDFKGYTVCVGNGERFVNINPFLNCPLKPMPERKPKDNSNEVNLGFELGWNACLEEIEK